MKGLRSRRDIHIHSLPGSDPPSPQTSSKALSSHCNCWRFACLQDDFRQRLWPGASFLHFLCLLRLFRCARFDTNVFDDQRAHTVHVINGDIENDPVRGDICSDIVELEVEEL